MFWIQTYLLFFKNNYTLNLFLLWFLEKQVKSLLLSLKMLKYEV